MVWRQSRNQGGESSRCIFGGHLYCQLQFPKPTKKKDKRLQFRNFRAGLFHLPTTVAFEMEMYPTRVREVRRSPPPTSLPPQPPLLLLLLRLPSCSGSSRSFGSSERQIVTGHSRCRDKGRRMGLERRERRRRRRRRLGTGRGAKKKKAANEDRRRNSTESSFGRRFRDRTKPESIGKWREKFTCF